MKRFLVKSGFLIGLLFLVASCEEQLEIDPIGSLGDNNTFLTVNDLQQGLNAAYTGVDQSDDIVFDIITDEVKIGADNGGQRFNFYNFNLNSQSGEATNHWTGNYFVINAVNRVLDGASRIEVDAADQAAYDNILGQLYGLRAFAHFNLLKWFATDYTDGSSLAVPYVDFIVTIEELPRNTVSEVVAGINADLAQAESLLGANNNELVTADMLTAIRARMALYLEDFAAAESFAQDLIDTYPLANTAQYQAMYGDADNTEVIFKARRVAGDAPIGGIWVFTGSGNPFLEMSNSLYDVLLANAAIDVRFGVNFWAAASDPDNNSHLVGKYLGPAFINDHKIFRVSEMYLIKAEAQARTGDLPGAADTLKELRDARLFDGFTSALESFANVNDALTTILAERRVELAFEGHRYLDIRRLRDVLNIGISRNAIDCPTGQCTLPPDDFRFNLPIPLAELNANSNMVQNPGYGS